MKRAKDYRHLAQEKLHGNYGGCIYIALLNTAIFSLLFLIPFGSVLFGGALSVGLCAFYLGVARSGKTNIKHLFHCFNGNIANVFVMDILRSLFLMFWAMVPIVGPIIVLVKSYSYAMAPYILIDNPEMNGCDAITASRALMRGKKFRLFCLGLSYIGWDILCAMTFGILLIWITPRKAVATAAFYDSIKAAEKPAQAPAAPAELPAEQEV